MDRSARLAVVLVAVLVVTPGCLSGPAGVGSTTPHPTFSDPVEVSLDYPAGEPVVAVASDGTIFFQGIGDTPLEVMNSVWRSTDDGRTWTDVTPPGDGRIGSRDGFLAVGNGDTVYVANAAKYTLRLFRSDDLGDTWVDLGRPTGDVPVHRMWIVTQGSGTVHLVVDRSPQYVDAGLLYVRSDDRGGSWTDPVVVDEAIHGSNLAIDPWTHALYVVRDHDQGRVLVASEDGGASWTVRSELPGPHGIEPPWTSLDVDANGTLYYVWSAEAGGIGSERSQVLYTFSTDGGTSWSDALTLAASDHTQTMPWAAVRGPGELAVAWLEAEGSDRPGNEGGPWYARGGFVIGADSAGPVAHVGTITDDPVRVGPVCLEGPACEDREHRRLIDYIWTDVGPDGRMHVAFAHSHSDALRAVGLHTIGALGGSSG